MDAEGKKEWMSEAKGTERGERKRKWIRSLRHGIRERLRVLAVM